MSLDKQRIIFDIDDTICTNHKKLSYDKCIPNVEVIKKINHLHDIGAEIILHTSRGMVSCNGDAKMAEEKNLEILKSWLENNGVKYDEIIFGKPIADLYVDDKAMSLNDFLNEEFGDLHGGSNNRIFRFGNVVKKNLGDDVQNFKEWYEDNEGILCVAPKISSYLYDNVYMEFIHGKRVVDVLSIEVLMKILETIKNFKYKQYDSFDLDYHLDILAKNRCNCDKYYFDDLNLYIDICENALIANANILKEEASFSHGDATLCNMILSDEDGKVYFIDPRYNKHSSSYLLDLAKLRMSLCDYEKTFGISNVSNKKFISILDGFADDKYEIVVILNFMYILRLYRYKDEEGKEKVYKMAKEFMRDNEDIFKKYIR